MKFASWFAAVLLGSATLLAAEEVADQPTETGFVPPQSWEEFVAYHQQNGDIGTWETRGKTVAMWEGIPAGLDYTARYGVQLAHDGQLVLYTHFMATATGQVISTGSGIAYWDAKSKTVKSSASGFDQGQLYTGHSTLIGIDKKHQMIKWHYTETSRGKTTEYFQTRRWVGVDRRLQTAQKVSGGDPWNEETTRVGSATGGTGVGPGILQRLRRVLRLNR